MFSERLNDISGTGNIKERHGATNDAGCVHVTDKHNKCVMTPRWMGRRASPQTASTEALGADMNE